jgi:addiction module HigA family antidote
MAIKEFRDGRLKNILQRKSPKGFPENLAAVTRRKLIMLDAARALADLKSPPANRLEALKGDRAGYHSIRVNDQMSNSSMTTDTSGSDLATVHPGEILREEFLVPLGLSAGALARALNVPRSRIERLVSEEVDLSPDTALRLARYFATSPEFWMSIQYRFALEKAADALGDGLQTIEPLQQAG